MALNAAQRAELEALGPDTVQGKLTHPVLGEAQSFQASSPTIFYAETLRIGSRKSIARKGVQKSVGPTSVLSWALPVLSWPLLASASASGWGWRSSLCAAVQRFPVAFPVAFTIASRLRARHAPWRSSSLVPRRSIRASRASLKVRSKNCLPSTI